MSSESLRWPLRGGAAVAVLAIAFWWGFLAWRSFRLDRDLRSAEKIFYETRDRALQATALERREESLLEALETARRGDPRGSGRVLGGIFDAAPEPLHVDRVDLTPSRVLVTGEARDFGDVATFIEKLDRSSSFAEPELRQLEKDGPSYRYSIFLERTPPGGS